MTVIPAAAVLFVALVLGVTSGVITHLLLGNGPRRKGVRAHVTYVRSQARTAVQSRPWADTNHKTRPVQLEHIDRSVMHRHL